MRNLIKRFRGKIGWIKYKLFDPRRIQELSGERVVFNKLKDYGFLNNLKSKRILEIGPKHGKDSLPLASLDPKELVLIDLPSKNKIVSSWFSNLNNLCKTKYMEGNILYLKPEEYEKLGKFDLIWCCGVIYHNVEQLRFLKKLFDLCNNDGLVVIESATTRNKKLKNLNIVEIHWPEPYESIPTITHLPSRLAIKNWLEMVGFRKVIIHNVYSKELSKVRAVLTGKKEKGAKPYIYYNEPDLNPPYYIGDAT